VPTAQLRHALVAGAVFLIAPESWVVLDQFEPVSVYRRTLEFIRNKADTIFLQRLQLGKKPELATLFKLNRATALAEWRDPGAA